MLPFLRSDLSEFTAYTPHPEAEAAGAAATGAIDRLDANENPLDLPAELKQKLAWSYQQTIEANRYPDGGHAGLKQAIAEYVNESLATATITPSQISIGNGSDELIRSLLIATCLNGQGSILVADPTFSMYKITAATLGIPVLSMGRRETDFAIDLTAAQQVITTSDPGLPPMRVVFVVHPNSPTGNCLTAAEQDWLRSLPPEILVVIDEAYFEFSRSTLAGELDRHSNWVILRTFSKAFRLAAHRVGYAIAAPELIAALEKIRLPYNLPAYSQAATAVALAHRQVLLPQIDQILQERDRLSAALEQIPGLRLWKSDANFIYLRTTPETATAQLGKDLKRLGTSVRYTGGGLRISIGTSAENDRTIQHIQELSHQGLQ